MTNVEECVIAALSEALDVPVSADVPGTLPEDRPEEFVTVELIRSSDEHYGAIEHAQLAVQTWAKTRLRACALGGSVKRAMYSRLRYPITSVRRTNHYNFPAEGSPRYQGVYEITAHSVID